MHVSVINMSNICGKSNCFDSKNSMWKADVIIFIIDIFKHNKMKIT